MSALVYAHVLTGLAGILAGLIDVAGTLCRKQLAGWGLVFILTTAASCATGFAFLPTDGVTSAQLVSFFLIALLAVAAYAHYGRGLEGSWNQVYALTTVGALFLNMLIATTQSFLHIRVLRELAPTQYSPVYVGVKLALLLVFLLIAFVAARRTGPSTKNL